MVSPLGSGLIVTTSLMLEIKRHGVPMVASNRFGRAELLWGRRDYEGARQAEREGNLVVELASKGIA